MICYLEDHPSTCKCLVTPTYNPFRPFGRGTLPYLGDLQTMFINHLRPSWDDPPSTCNVWRIQRERGNSRDHPPTNADIGKKVPHYWGGFPWRNPYTISLKLNGSGQGSDHLKTESRLPRIDAFFLYVDSMIFRTSAKKL